MDAINPIDVRIIVEGASDVEIVSQGNAEHCTWC
jgi:predicted nuclease with TOPRIM domain